MSRRTTYVVAWIFSAAAILLLVFPWNDLQGHTHWEKVQWVPFITPPIRLRDIVANVLLYLPFGFLGRRVMAGSVGSTLTLGLGGALSIATESAQLYSHYRFPSATDLTCNLVGAAIGLWLATATERVHRPLVQEFTS